MFIVEERKGKRIFIKAREINLENLKALSSNTARKILSLLAINNLSAKEIAKKLSLHEQNIYYHIENLEKAGIIEVKEIKKARGFEEKLYGIKEHGYYFILKKKKERGEINKIIKEAETVNEFLFPFIEDGKFNSIVIIGSPEPHGIEKARSKDAYFAFDLAFLLGSFINRVEKEIVKLDTEIKKEELENNNLIIIGGPIVNAMTFRINEKLPVIFLRKEKAYFSKKSGKKYYDDEIGIIIKGKSPFNKNKKILVIEGKRYIGTKSCVIAFTKYLAKLSEKINEKGYAIVKGYDLDSDGLIDDIDFVE